MRTQAYLTVSEAARSIGVSRQAVHQWITAGRVKARSFAGRKFLTRSDVARIAERRGVVGQGQSASRPNDSVANPAA